MIENMEICTITKFKFTFRLLNNIILYLGLARSSHLNGSLSMLNIHSTNDRKNQETSDTFLLFGGGGSASGGFLFIFVYFHLSKYQRPVFQTNRQNLSGT